MTSGGSAIFVRRLSIAVALTFAASVFAQDEAAIPALRASQHPLSNIGLAIGEHIPEFKVADQTGTLRDFESIRGPKGAVLYFYRSADWCIYCQTQLEETEASRETLLKNGLGLAGISFDSQEVLKKFSDEKDIRFPLLSDPVSKLIREFRVLDETVLPDSTGYGVPYHGAYIIDADGRVSAKLFDAEAVLSHTSGAVVTRLFGSPLNTHEKQVTHNHLKLHYYASTNTASLGDEIELFVDVELNDGIHVYAPPAEPFTPVDWQMAAQPGVQFEPPLFPPAQTLRVGPSGDTASVYLGRFQIKRRATLDTDAPPVLDAQGNVSIKGSFKFQACDQQICYSPITIPIEWKFTARSGAEFSTPAADK